MKTTVIVIFLLNFIKLVYTQVSAQQAATTVDVLPITPSLPAIVSTTTQNIIPTTTTIIDIPITTEQAIITTTQQQDQAQSTDIASTKERNKNKNQQATDTLLQASQTGTPSTTDATQPSNITDSPPQDNSNKTAIIAGSVVGGLVAIAIIAGLLTWMNRRGGCTSRTRRRDNIPIDFENANDDNDDYPMKENNQHSPFQHTRRLIPPTNGYMNLTDNEYYPQQQQDYYNQNPEHYPAQQQNYLSQDNDYYSPQKQAYNSHEYYSQQTPTVYYDTSIDMNNRKPDQIDQKPNVA